MKTRLNVLTYTSRRENITVVTEMDLLIYRGTYSPVDSLYIHIGRCDRQME
jgi:hypothetical protein